MKINIEDSLDKLENWMVDKKFKAFDPFDGLNSFGLRLLTFNNSNLLVVLQNIVRQSPLNIRPLFGIKPNISSKGMAYLSRGFLYKSNFKQKEESEATSKLFLKWLLKNSNQKYTGISWGNHFDYKSRLFYLRKGEPTAVWTSLIGHVFMDAYEKFKCELYLKVANSACKFILNDLPKGTHSDGICISYIPDSLIEVHNSNMLASSLLSRVSYYNKNTDFSNLSDLSMQYSIRKIKDDFSWYYSEDELCDYVDNFHTGYNLDSLFYYNKYRSEKHKSVLSEAFKYYIDNFFDKGVPKYYNNKKYPIDIQCCSQSIETLIKLREFDKRSERLALDVVKWTIKNMQDPKGFFYFRKYPLFFNKTPMMHWGLSTMFNSIYYALAETKNHPETKSNYETISKK